MRKSRPFKWYNALFVLSVACVCAHGQAMRNLNGSGTNATLWSGLTLRPGAPAANIGVTNIGVMLVYLGSGPLGTQMAFLDTNNIPRIVLAGGDFSLVDLFGNTQHGINAQSIAIGRGALSGATLLTGSTNILAYGLLSLGGATITNSSRIFAYGEGALQDSDITNSSRIFAFGDSPMEDAHLTNSSRVFAYGEGPLEAATIRGTTEVFAYGVGVLANAILLNGNANLFAYGVSAMDSATITNSSDIYAFGNAAFANTLLTNSSDMYAIGNSAGDSMAGTFTHVFLIGSGATATGDNQMVFGDSAYTYIFPGVSLIGNGAGLTNLVGATNFSSSVTYNFNGKTTFNAVSYNTNLWAGPTNTLILSTNYQDFITTTDCNITNVGGQLAGQNTWATLTISNASAADITVRSTAAGIRLQGSGSTAALVIGAGKEGILSYLCRDLKSTNVVTTAQSN